MEFYEVLDQAVELLRKRGRVSYSALKVQFNLDDTLLEALKDELLFTHPVTDEHGRGLVWTGNATPSLTVASQAPEAERRQLTVMFCDVVESTTLSGQLDPEDLRHVIRAYQTTCIPVIQGFDGYVAQLLGDGLLVYFGYPQAHEDDAQRAIRSGLGMLAAMEGLNAPLKHQHGICLALRLGIHTGLVVVGDMGGADRPEQLALGETPNVAARVQGVAEPNTLVITDATYRLAQGYFECESLGEHHLRGVAQLLHLYHVVRESRAQSRLDVITPQGLTPLVGRESELRLLFDRWRLVQGRAGQVVLLSGEAGIGKSRLLQAVKTEAAVMPHTHLECRCSPYHQHTTLYPITDLMYRVLEWTMDDTTEAKLNKLETALGRYQLEMAETIPLLTDVLSLPVAENRYNPFPLTPQRRRQKTLEVLVAMLLQEAERQPLLFIVEDIHWIDPTTQALLGMLIDQSPASALLILLTCRPEFQPFWSRRSNLTEVSLSRLSQSHTERMIERIANGKRLPADVRREIVEKTDGVPLFVEEITKAVLESGLLHEQDEHYELMGPIASLAIPATLHDSLMARLDRLGNAKGIAQRAAAIGRQFSYMLLQAISQLDDDTLERQLEELVEAELIYRRGVSPQVMYVFRHALLQDAAYQSLLRQTRQQLHWQIAEVLETRFPETSRAQPELVAYHYTEALAAESAIPYWQQAGQRARQRSADVEAIAHFRRGLELLSTLPATPERVRQELTMQISLGSSLLVTRGYAAHDAIRTFTRAHNLCLQIGEAPELPAVLIGLWLFYSVRPDFQKAQEVAEQLFQLAQDSQDSRLLLRGYLTLGVTALLRGNPGLAHAHLERGLALYDPDIHDDVSINSVVAALGISILSTCGWSLWLLGYPEQARMRCDEALGRAQSLAHPYTLARTLYYHNIVYQLRREPQVVLAQAEIAIAMATEQAFAFPLALGTISRGWSLAVQGQGATGLQQLRQGIEIQRSTGGECLLPHALALLSETYHFSGQPEEGLKILSEALLVAKTTGEQHYLAELYRLKGELILSQTDPDAHEAESCFQKALDTARQQEAKSWELRAAVSQARLWQGQGKQEEAYNLLAPMYAWFTEGLDTVDLQDARALLDALVLEM